MAQSRKVGSFDPREVTLVVAGTSVSGYADGTFITVSRANDNFNMASGADGEVTRVRTVDLSGTIVVTLQMSSSSNNDFSTLMLADEKTGKAAFAVTMKDGNGDTVVSGSVAWFTKPADVGFSKDVETREWTIQVAHMEMFVGGTADITP